MSRSRRSKSQASAAAAEGLSVLDKLVLAQAVWEVGPSSWLKISRIMGKHSLLTHPKTFFTAQSCHAMYDHLMKEAGFEISDANHAVHAPTHLKLAEKYYAERVEELRTLIGAEEQQFKAILAEINEIRAGQRDEEVKARITGIPAPEKEAEEIEVVPEQDVSADAVTSTVEDEAPGVEDEAPKVEDEAPKVEDEASKVEDEAPKVEDEAPEVEMATAEPEIPQEQEAPSILVALPPSPEAVMEDIETQPEETAVPAPPAENSPPEATSSPTENLDHLMQASDDETHDKAPDAEVSEPIPQEQTIDTVSENAPEEASVENTEPAMDDVPLDAQHGEETMDQSESKPVSQNSEGFSVPESGETISTRRSTRRRPSVSLAPAPVPAKKRGRKPQQKSSPEPEPEPEPEAEPEPAPAPAVKEATPAVDEAQPEEEVPLSAAMRRRESKRKASFFGGLDSPRDRKRAREDSEPVDDDEQGTGSAVLRRRGTGRTEEQVALKRFQTVITMVHSQISQHRNGNIFHNPIKPSEAPDYHDIVKRPIDLKTIKAKIKDGVIGNSLEYQRDICLMFANAMMYNRPGSDVHVMAEDMMVESDSHINTFRQTEGYVRGSRI